MQSYLYQTIAIVPGKTYTVSFDYSADADITEASLYAGFAVDTEIAAQTNIDDLTNLEIESISVGPNDSGTQSFEFIVESGQNTLFLAVILDTIGNVTFDNVSVIEAGGTEGQVGNRFDFITLRRGEINNLYYYSRFGWQNEAGTYIENSLDDTDIINCETEEYDIILAKCAELAADDVDEEKVAIKQETRYKQLKKAYEMTNPSEALIMIETVADFIKV